MGQGACGGYLKRDFSLIKSTKGSSSQENNNDNMSDAKRIADLEEKLRRKEEEIEGYQVNNSLLLSSK